jgi:tetratricopeptide (TPR) repeat protein
MAYMKYQCYEHALADFSSFQAPMKLPAIGLYQAALALYTLRRFDECQSRLMELLEDYPDDKPGQEMLLRARQRLHEQKTGDYDFSAMYEKLQRGQRELDIATYTSSLVIGQTESHGRGLFTTEAVKAGQLLTCEKASVYCCPAAETVSATDFITVLASPHDSMGMLGAEGELVKLAVQQIFYNRSAASNIVESYCGSYKPTTVTGLIDGQPVVD